jgi:hypothetical protein
MRIILKPGFFVFMITAICLFAVFSYFKSVNINMIKKLNSQGIKEFYESGKLYDIEIDANIEKNYFSGQGLKNSSFSHGTVHWAMTGVNEDHTSKPPENTMTISSKEYVSAPYSLKICAQEYPCRLFYTKDSSAEIFIKHPWGFSTSKAWLGIGPLKTVILELFYKGARPTVSLCLLDNLGRHMILNRKIAEQESEQWQKCSLKAKIPEDGRAIMIEIQVTSLIPGAVMYLDDINLKIDDNE